ncbi:MAG: META domain-containing protein, partial [Methanomicrobiales archaeon]|nr:META domain-containing protein [Methanomicrobiales archaeon]
MASNGRSNTKTLASVMLLAIAVASIVTAGCMTGTTTPGAIVGIPWSLDSYLAENNTLIPALPGSDVSARFGPDGRVAG